MILAIDIGNTTISSALVSGSKVKNIFSVRTGQPSGRLNRELLNAFTRAKRRAPEIEAIVICSVVPWASRLVGKAAKKTFRLRPFLIGKNLKVPIKNLYRKPSEVGQDRLVCAYAAREFYVKPAIVVDFGTAITFDAISKAGDYLGGAIVPGLRLYTESLFEKTALLPKVKIRHPKGVIGRNTADSILSGIFYGYGSLYKGIIELISGKLGGEPCIVITGGYSGLLRRYINRVDRFDPALIFRGIYLAYQKQSKKRK